MNALLTTTGLTQEQARSVAAALDSILADTYMLSGKTKRSHWHVTGPQFSSLHTLFEQQYEELDAMTDNIAEYIMSLGAMTNGTLLEFQKTATVREQERDQRLSGIELCAMLREDHTMMVKNLRTIAKTLENDHGDQLAADFVRALANKHIKMAWLLRASSNNAS